MSAKVYITVLLEYESVSATPKFSSGMTVLGGAVAAVSFSDVFEERDQLEQQISEGQRAE